MRIAILSDGVHPYVVGGMQRHTFYLCKYLSRNGIQVTLVHFNQSDRDIEKLDIFTNEERQNIESIVIPFPASDGFPGHYVRASYRYSCLVFDRLKDRFNEFDFIYAKGFSAWKLLQEKQKTPGRFPPIGVKFHGYEMFQKQADFTSFLKSLLLRSPVRWISRHADYVFSYGSGITKIILKIGVPEYKIIELPAGIEASWITDKAPQTGKNTVFTYLGRYERRKGIEELNAVLRALKHSSGNFIFHFIGPFQASQMVQSDRIVYHGPITDNAGIMAILDETDFLVCPSWSEGMPNVILEAMARSCAIVASDVGVSDMVDEKNGFLIQPGNTEALRNALIKAMETDQEQLLIMKKASLDKIKSQFRYERIIDAFVQKINTIIHS
jgi:glycosyltransferase involved in cell wall biosynthesis